MFLPTQPQLNSKTSVHLWFPHLESTKSDLICFTLTFICWAKLFGTSIACQWYFFGKKFDYIFQTMYTIASNHLRLSHLANSFSIAKITLEFGNGHHRVAEIFSVNNDLTNVIHRSILFFLVPNVNSYLLDLMLITYLESPDFVLVDLKLTDIEAIRKIWHYNCTELVDLQKFFSCLFYILVCVPTQTMMQLLENKRCYSNRRLDPIPNSTQKYQLENLGARWTAKTAAPWLKIPLRKIYLNNCQAFYVIIPCWIYL